MDSNTQKKLIRFLLIVNRIIGITGCLIGIGSLYVIPVFMELFTELGVELSALTRFFSSGICSWILILGGVVTMRFSFSSKLRVQSQLLVSSLVFFGGMTMGMIIVLYLPLFTITTVLK